MNPNPKEILQISINQALQFSEKGKTTKAQELLLFIYEITLQYPNLLWNNKDVWKLGKCFLILYHYDVFDSEEENLQLAKYAFLYNYRAISLIKKNDSDIDLEELFNSYYSQSVLLSSCKDCFVYFISQLYSHPKMSAQENSVSIKLADKILPIITYDTLIEIEELFPNFKNNAFLQDLCNFIELENPEISENQLKDAKKIQDLLYQTFLKEITTNK